jgi:hypothetical protein
VPVVFGQNAVLRAAMPKTTIDEYRYFCRSKNEIRTTRQVGCMQPKAQPKPMDATP